MDLGIIDRARSRHVSNCCDVTEGTMVAVKCRNAVRYASFIGLVTLVNERLDRCWHDPAKAESVNTGLQNQLAVLRSEESELLVAVEAMCSKQNVELRKRSTASLEEGLRMLIQPDIGIAHDRQRGGEDVARSLCSDLLEMCQPPVKALRGPIGVTWGPYRDSQSSIKPCRWACNCRSCRHGKLVVKLATCLCAVRHC